MLRITHYLALLVLAPFAMASTGPYGHIILDPAAARAGFRPAAEVLAIWLGDGVPWDIQEEAAKVSKAAAGVGDHYSCVVIQVARDLTPESFRVTQKGETLALDAADKAGALFGVGHLLRHLALSESGAVLLGGAHTETPAMPLRGHQLGYRAQANSYDAWTVEQFEQHIVELAFFGTNMIENIPFQDDRPLVNTKVPRREMNRAMSAICEKYGLQYWVWTPADFDLKERDKAEAQLDQYEELYVDCPRLDGVFFPGGDPGDNPPELVMPYLGEVAARLAKHHPQARIWMSVQGFSLRQIDYVYDWIRANRPKWLGGLVAGPSSPTIQSMRRQLAPEYGLRDYPDITHTVRCQNPVPWWDPAFAATLGRECINVRPVFHKVLFQFFAPFLSGFGTYSDGIHDDINKIVYSRLGCAPNSDVREILVEYARLFWGDAHAEKIADALLALEKGWEGPLKDNGTVESTLSLWLELEQKVPTLATTWRGQMFLTLAEYNAYIRRRLVEESELEWDFIARVNATDSFDDGTLDSLVASLQPASNEDPASNKDNEALRVSIAKRFDFLFHNIGLQSSVEQYQASGRERGCSLDTMDYPMNNRWWIEDEFKKVRALPLAERAAAVRAIANWENPGPGGLYDNLGHPGKSPHVVRGMEIEVEPDLERIQPPTHWMWDDGKSRKRLSWQVTMDWPTALRYDGLKPGSSYRLRLTGYGKAYPVADGLLLAPLREGTEIGAIKEFEIPRDATADGKLEITFRRPTDEADLNWRQQSRASEAWLEVDDEK